MRTIACVVLAAVFVLGIPREAGAVKRLVHLSLEDLDRAGFLISATQRGADRLLAVTIARDVTKAHSFPPDAGLQIVRSATMEMYGSAGLIFRIDLDPTNEKQTVVYRFQIAPDQLENCHITINEIDDYKPPQEIKLLGGGTIFQFRLSDVLKP